MRARAIAILAILGFVGARQADPLRLERLATDEELRFDPPGVEAPDDPIPGHPIRSLVSPDFSDLAFLREALGGARIVQLGESGHGTGKAFLLKARLVRFLYRELGFGVIAFESDLYRCYAADRAAKTVPARTTLLGCAFGVWHTEEVLPLFEYMARTPLRVAGFDVQPIGTNKEHRPRFLADLVRPLEPEYARSVLTLDSTLLAEYAKGSRSRRGYFRAHRDELLEAYDGLAAYVDVNRAAIAAVAGREAALVGAQTARSISAYVRQQTAADLRTYAEARDAGMADNVRFLVEELFPGQRVVLWGHNAHVRHANEDIPVRGGYSPVVASRSMGSWLRERYGEAVFTIGSYAFRGTAVDNARQPYPIAPAPPGTLEHRLAEAGSRVWLVDLRRLVGSPGGEWALAPQIARYNGQVYQVLVPADQYDAVVLIADVSPPRFLY